MSIEMTVIADSNDEFELQLAEDCSRFYDDPLGWVLWAFDWNEDELQGFNGPDDWQRDVLSTIGEEISARRFCGVAPVDPTRIAVASGHG